MQLANELLIDFIQVEDDPVKAAIALMKAPRAFQFNLHIGIPDIQSKSNKTDVQDTKQNGVPSTTNWQSDFIKQLFLSFKSFVESNKQNPNKPLYVVTTSIGNDNDEISGKLIYFTKHDSNGKEFFPPLAPENLKYSEITHSEMVLNWDELKGVIKFLTYYEVSYEPIKDKESQRDAKPYVQTNEKSVQLSNLCPVTEYIVKVRSLSDAGWSAWSETLKVKTTNEIKEEYNLLLLGATGVGKSTFINAFVNYVKYKTLEEAKKGGIQSVIPTSFTVTQNGTTQKVTIGDTSGHGENLSVTGQSSTQSLQSYRVKINTKNTSYFLNLIDTPGIGDTRGTEQDKKIWLPF